MGQIYVKNLIHSKVHNSIQTLHFILYTKEKQKLYYIFRKQGTRISKLHLNGPTTNAISLLFAVHIKCRLCKQFYYI